MTQVQLQISSYNCNGLGNFIKRKEVFTWLNDKPYNIICLQETHSTLSVETMWQNEWGGSIIFSHGTSSQRGTAILFKNNINPDIHQIKTDINGRWVIIDLTIDSYRFCLVNLYAPNEDSPEFFTNLSVELENFVDCNENLIITGDFNTVQNPLVDRHSTNRSYHTKALECISELKCKYDLHDIWRFRNPKDIRYTWRRRLQASRIDYFLVSFSLINRVNKCIIGDRFRSDHNLIALSFITAEFPRGKGFWKFNTSLLEDKLFHKKTVEIMKEFFSNNCGTANPHSVWEAAKGFFRGHSIKFSSWKNKQYLAREK